MLSSQRCMKLSQLVLLIVALLALYTCPHSKVEESFNLQATHDLFYHGVEPAWRSVDVREMLQVGDSSTTCAASNAGVDDVDTCGSNADSPYDHLQFPGVVPRTFIGAFFLSLIARFISWIIPKQIFDVASHPLVVQFLIRLELLLLSWIAHVRLARAGEAYVNRQSQQQSSSNGTQSLQSTSPTTTIASYYLLITASQFHIPFYSSRLLPNTFALILVTHAYAEWFRRNYRLTAMYLVFTSAIFRCDMLLLLFTVGLVLLIQRQMTIVQALSVGVTTGVLSLLLTVPLDSLLWGRLIWPEFEVWWFNTVDNRSGEYGEMVWHWYFTKALPKGMLLTALLVPLAFLRVPECVASCFGASQSIQKGLIDLSLFGFFAPILGFITLYSLLPHKEIRFIFPALPMINVCAAYGMSRLHTLVFAKSQTKAKQWVCIGMYLCGVGCIALSMLGSLIFLRLSTDNYPGGVALERLRRHLNLAIPSSTP
eukprot:g13836.t1 g13836   contig9:572359-574006(-)